MINSIAVGPQNLNILSHGWILWQRVPDWGAAS